MTARRSRWRILSRPWRMRREDRSRTVPSLVQPGRHPAAGCRRQLRSAIAGTFTLTVRQNCPPTPGQPDKKPLHIPLAIGLLDRNGRELPCTLAGETATGPTNRVLEVTTGRGDLSSSPDSAKNRFRRCCGLSPRRSGSTIHTATTTWCSSWPTKRILSAAGRQGSSWPSR